MHFFLMASLRYGILISAKIDYRKTFIFYFEASEMHVDIKFR